jgi:hypothetical protein
MRNLLIICLLLGSMSAFGQLTKKMAQDTLIWSKDSLLTKEDFQAKRSAYGSKIPAYVSVFLYLYQKENEGQRMFYVEAILLKSKSYMKEETPYTLKHEQLHFDICELYARKLRQKIDLKDFTKVRDVGGELQKLYDKTSAELWKEESKYDDDTQHGINAAKQQIWMDNIAKQLAELEKYSSTEVNIVK